jgi:hypothetical protein
MLICRIHDVFTWLVLDPINGHRPHWFGSHICTPAGKGIRDYPCPRNDNPI